MYPKPTCNKFEVRALFGNWSHSCNEVTRTVYNKTCSMTNTHVAMRLRVVLGFLKAISVL